MFLATGLKFPEENTEQICQMEQRCFAVDFKDRKSFMQSLVCVFIYHIVMLPFNNTAKEVNFLLFPMYPKESLAISSLPQG